MATAIQSPLGTVYRVTKEELERIKTEGLKAVLNSDRTPRD